MKKALAAGVIAGVVITGVGWSDGGAHHQVRNLHFGVSGSNGDEVSKAFCCGGTLGSNVDAAVAALRSGTMDSTGFIEDIGTISSTPATAAIGMAVEKSGRTTRLTTGSIDSVESPRLMGHGAVLGAGVGAGDENPSEAAIVIYFDRTTGAIPVLPDQVRGMRVKRVFTDPIVSVAAACTE